MKLLLLCAVFSIPAFCISSDKESERKKALADDISPTRTLWDWPDETNPTKLLALVKRHPTLRAPFVSHHRSVLEHAVNICENEEDIAHTLQTLIDAGVPVDQENIFYNTLLQNAARFDFAVNLSIHNTTIIIETLLKNKASIDKISTRDGRSALQTSFTDYSGQFTVTIMLSKHESVPSFVNRPIMIDYYPHCYHTTYLGLAISHNGCPTPQRAIIIKNLLDARADITAHEVTELCKHHDWDAYPCFCNLILPHCTLAVLQKAKDTLMSYKKTVPGLSTAIVQRATHDALKEDELLPDVLRKIVIGYIEN